MKATKPRASKTKVSWMRKQNPDEAKKTRRRAYIPATKPFKPSKHPIVIAIREAEEEEGGPLSSDEVQAISAGFRAAHCTETKFSGREIAKMRLPDGRMKRMYACDVCGHVGSKVSHT